MQPFNFSSQSSYQTKSLHTWYIISGTLVGALIIVLSSINYYQYKELHRLRIQAQEYKKTQDLFIMHQQKNAHVNNKNDHSKKILATILHDIGTIIPDDVYLESFMYNRSSLHITGYALQQKNVAYFIDQYSQSNYLQSPACMIDYREDHEPAHMFTFTASCMNPAHDF